jgi:FlaA1/EpsC-like NDP-sugar epimerase
VVDQNENDLAELVRYLRNKIGDLSSTDFRTFPLDFGSLIMFRFLTEMPAYDFVLNFAALKHVRSEKDVYSLLRMYDVNLVKAARFFGWLSKRQASFRYFCVSTDKAADPVNLMGASKHLMERLIFSDEFLTCSTQTAASARFANVAFSKGSLLESFLIRLNNRQPLAVPEKTLRYFISPEESGQICVLAAFCAPNRHVLIPALEAGSDLVELEEVADMVLHQFGLRPQRYKDELLAKDSVQVDLEKGCYPVLLTPLDTSGEKPYEEFVGDGEKTVDIGMTVLLGIEHEPKPTGPLMSFIQFLEETMSRSETPITKGDIVERVKCLIPNFKHRETEKNLDERM